jgi:hypothetical protein
MPTIDSTTIASKIVAMGEAPPWDSSRKKIKDLHRRQDDQCQPADRSMLKAGFEAMKKRAQNTAPFLLDTFGVGIIKRTGRSAYGNDRD